MKKLLLSIVLSTTALHAQTASVNPQFEGIWEGYDGEWDRTCLDTLSDQLVMIHGSQRPPKLKEVSKSLSVLRCDGFGCYSAGS
jgi:hypothetical protein